MFSQTQEYALRAVIWLAQQPSDQAVGNAKIAEGTAVPASYLSKILQKLTVAEILTSRRGVGGGFTLAIAADQISIYEVISAVDPCKRILTCPLGLKTHQKKLCPAHARLDAALAMVEESLRNSTIAEVMFEPGRPLPLVETPLEAGEEEQSPADCAAECPAAGASMKIPSGTSKENREDAGDRETELPSS